MKIKSIIKSSLLIFIGIFILNACSSSNNDEGLNDSTLTDTKNKCSSEFQAYEHYLTDCDLTDKAKLVFDVECFLYKESYKYSETELQEGRDCVNNISTLTCQELENTSSLDDVDGCPTFKTKPVKSKKELCAENYLLFCQNQLDKCGEAELDAQCDGAKYTETNSQGLDAKTSFKMDKLLEFCVSEGDTDATVNDLDCIIQANNASTVFTCEKTFEVFRSGCTQYFD